MQSTESRNLPVARAFDNIASDYDELWTKTVVGTIQRQQVWRELETFFSTGDHILEIGCGTGADATHLALRGVRVCGIDVSAKMLLAAARRIKNEGVAERVILNFGTIEELSENIVAESFDGAFSNFGVFNCIRDLRSAASSLARLIRPGGKVGICIMTRFCLWESAWFLIHGHSKKAFRRLRNDSEGTAVSLGGVPFRIHYPAAAQLIQAFSPQFTFLSSSGIGVLTPPTCVEPWARKQSSALKLLDTLNTHFRHFPVMRAIGDHRLYWFKKFRDLQNTTESG